VLSWNSRVPAGAAFHDNARLHENNGVWWVNYEAYSNPVYVASSSDPFIDVTVPDSWGWPAATLHLRAPANIAPAAGTDASVVLLSGGTSYDFWIFTKQSTSKWTARAYAESDIVNGSGFGTSSPFKGAGIRAAGTSGLAGEIYGSDELASANGIHHALAVAGLPGVFCADAPLGYVAPAISGDSACEGPRVAIPASTPMPAGLSVPGQAVWNALKTYGGWSVDTVGGSAPVVLNADPRSVPSSQVVALLNDLPKITPAVRMVNR
jgi:hypothetical protein